MRVKEGVPKVMGVAVGLGRFRRRPACAMYADRRKRAAVALLVIAPLPLTGDVDIFALNLVDLGFGARCCGSRGPGPGNRRHKHNGRQKQQQHRGGHDDDGNGDTEEDTMTTATATLRRTR